MTVERTPKMTKPTVVVVPESTNSVIEVDLTQSAAPAVTKVTPKVVAVEPATQSEWFNNLEAALSNTIEPFLVELDADIEAMIKYGSFSVNKGKLLTAVNEILSKQLEKITQRLS